MKIITPSVHRLETKIMDPRKLLPCKKWPKACSNVVQLLSEDS